MPDPNRISFAEPEVVDSRGQSNNTAGPSFNNGKFPWLQKAKHMTVDGRQMVHTNRTEVMKLSSSSRCSEFLSYFITIECFCSKRRTNNIFSGTAWKDDGGSNCSENGLPVSLQLQVVKVLTDSAVYHRHRNINPLTKFWCGNINLLRIEVIWSWLSNTLWARLTNSWWDSFLFCFLCFGLNWHSSYFQSGIVEFYVHSHE